MTIVEIQKLESKYLKAKIAYYNGTPIMTDHEFDVLEQLLKKEGSKAPEQVGSKRKDFDFPHPSNMLSLAKIQTEDENGSTNYMEPEFLRWYNKQIQKVGNQPLEATPKFDGNALNIIYSGKNRVLQNVLTRGDKEFGKNVTQRFLPHLPNNLAILDLNITEDDVIEIRAEVVIDINLFNKRYKGTKEEGKYANARNYVAGVLSKDDFSVEKVSELKIIPLHYLVNGIHVNGNHFRHNAFYEDWIQPMNKNGYIDIIKYHEDLRKTIKYQLDGVVISFPVSERKILGENSHDPEWAIAIKFIPEGAITTVKGIEWNVGKRGQLTPVILLEPVQLDGTTVKRASGYNAGYLKDNGIGIGAVTSIAKAGDIIPEIQSVISETTQIFELPEICPDCETDLTFDGIHLLCPNELCVGRISKKLATAGSLKVLNLKSVGPEILKPFAVDFYNMFELVDWVLTRGKTEDIEQYGITFNSRSHEIFVQAFENIKSIPYEKVVQLLGYDNVGDKITIQLAREHAGLDFSYASLEKALVEKLHEPNVVEYIDEAVTTLESFGITIDRPKAAKAGGIGVVLTGSPKVFGFATKKEFLEKYPNLVECSMSDATCKYLITDDLNSTTSKMKMATKKGIEIKTYGNF